MILGLAAQAQEAIPELEGGPGSHPLSQKALTTKQATTRQVRATADKLKAQQARLAQQAADLKAQQAKLDARAAELAAEEKRLAKLRADQEADHAARLAEIARQKAAVEKQAAALHDELKTKPLPPPRPAVQTAPQQQMADANAGAPIDITKPAAIEAPAVRSDAVGQPEIAEKHAVPDKPALADRDNPDALPEASRALTAHLDLDAARRSCARAGEDAALARRYYSARYDDAVRVYQDRGWKLSGRMRLEDRRGYLLIDTICEVDADGEAQRFSFLRR
jgi:hypothetical protein